MSERVLRVRIRTIGSAEVQRAIRGISSGARQAARSQIAADRETTREASRNAASRLRSAQREQRERVRGEQQVAREAQRAAASRARAEEQASRDVMRNAQRENQALFRMNQALNRARARERREAHQASLRRAEQVGGAMLGGVSTAGALALSSVAASLDSVVRRLDTITSAVGARAGVVDIGQRTAQAQDFELALARSSGEFFQGQDPAQLATSTAALQAEILGIAEEMGQSPTDLLDVLSSMQSEFSAFEVGRANLRAIAAEAQRTGAEMDTLGRFIGVLNQQLGDSAPSADRAFDIMAQGGLEGAITPESFAENFGGMFGAFQTTSGATGEDALRQFAALANAVRPGAQTDAEAATQLHGLIETLQTPETRDHIRESLGGRRVGRGASEHWVGGSTAFREDGTVDYMQLIRDMSTVQDTERGVGVATALHNSRARDAMVSLTRAQRGETTAPSAEALASVSAEEGRAFREGNLQTVMGTSAIESRRLAVLGETEGIRELQPRAEDANEQLLVREAVTQTASEGLIAGIQNIPLVGDWLSQHAVPWLAAQASGLSPEQRQTMDQWQQPLSGALSAVSPGMAAAFDANMGLVRSFAEVGDRAGALQQRMDQGPTELAPGTTVELGQSTIQQLATATASASATLVPTSTAPSSPSARRTDRTRRP